MKFSELIVSEQSSPNKPFAMIIFGSIRLYWKKLGIKPSISNQNSSINVKNSMILFLFILSAISSSAFLLLNEKTPMEFENAFIDVSSMFTVVFIMAICIWKVNTIFQFMTNFEQVIRESE